MVSQEVPEGYNKAEEGNTIRTLGLGFLGLRPDKDSYVSASEEQPYEIHFISFNSDKNLNDFIKDDSRLNFIHLKEESIKSTILVRGLKM